MLTTITGENEKDNFSVVAGVGDVNADGFDDLLVGATGGNYAKLYFGGSSFDTLNYIKLTPDQGFTYGASVAGGGDLNGDGYADFIVGAPQSSVFEPVWLGNAGKVFVYLGAAQVDTIPYMVLNGQGWYYDFGRSLAFAGDVNNDGYDDIIIGAPMDDIDGRGRAYIYCGGADMDDIEDVFMEGEAGADAFGGSVSGAGDVNKDGFDDVLIGATQWGAVEPIGKAYLVYGGNEIGLENATIFTDSSAVYFGLQVAGLGDVNGNGDSDFIISSLKNAYLYLGINTRVVIHSEPAMGFGGYVNVAGGGDINNDGLHDFVIGNSNYINENDIMVGLVWGYFGDASIDTLHDFSLEGETKWSNFSRNATIVDINEDGFSEVVVGTLDFPDSESSIGKVYIFSYDFEEKIEVENGHNPTHLSLFQNYPNPFNSRTKINFLVDRSEKLQLAIYSTHGQLIETLIDHWMDAGSHSVTWDARQLASGVYVCRLSTEKYSDTIKILLVK